MGRAKELIISGGLNVYPKEVENILEAHEAILEAAVYGSPDEDLGEKVLAAVVLKEGALCLRRASSPIAVSAWPLISAPKKWSSCRFCPAMPWGRYKNRGCQTNNLSRFWNLLANF